MSIATEARVAELEKQVAELASALAVCRSAINSFGVQLAHNTAQLVELERSAMRKPGPKPKDSHG